MKNSKISAVVILIIVLFTSCTKEKSKEKLEQKKANILLERGGEWVYDRFEIDGGDSTNKHFGVVNTKHNGRTVTFEPKRDEDDMYYKMEAESYAGNYYFDSDNKTKIIFHDLPVNCPSGTIYKPGEMHNIFLQVAHGETEWDIVSLTTDEFIVSCAYKKKYLIKLIRPLGAQ